MKRNGEIKISFETARGDEREKGNEKRERDREKG